MTKWDASLLADHSDVLVVGAGYLGRRVAQMAVELSHQGNLSQVQVYATTRREARMRELAAAGFSPLRYDWTDRATYANLPWQHISARPRVLVAVSYDRHSSIDRYSSQVGGLRSLLQEMPPDARVCYISTTGVYHQTDGRWVDETSPTHPSRLGGRVHLQAEQVLHRMRPHSPWSVLRLAGIYGPGRVPRARDVIAGQSIASNANGFLNLIHVHDAARAVLASWAKFMPEDSTSFPVGMQSRLYAVADDEPVVRGDFYREIARLCNAPPPSFTDPPADASARMRSDSNKRVDNRKLRRELLPRLVFPDYRAGLANVLSGNLE